MLGKKKIERDNNLWQRSVTHFTRGKNKIKPDEKRTREMCKTGDGNFWRQPSLAFFVLFRSYPHASFIRPT